MFPRDMDCLRNISVDTLHKGDTENDDNNDNNFILLTTRLKSYGYRIQTKAA
jgi:hypothetical protein